MKKDKKYSVVIREEYVGGVTLAYEEFYNEEFSLHVIEKIAKGFDLKLDEYDEKLKLYDKRKELNDIILEIDNEDIRHRLENLI